MMPMVMMMMMVVECYISTKVAFIFHLLSIHLSIHLSRPTIFIVSVKLKPRISNKEKKKLNVAMQAQGIFRRTSNHKSSPKSIIHV